jgi:hypothetical protein
MIRGIALFASIYLVLVAQEFIPPLPFLGGAHLILVPVLFCYGALWLSFPVMLGLALFTGLLSDLAFLHVVGDRVEIGLGWSMLFYVLLGTALQPLQPLFREGRWEVHCLAAGAATLFFSCNTSWSVCAADHSSSIGPFSGTLPVPPCLRSCLRRWFTSFSAFFPRVLRGDAAAEA